MGVDLSVEGSDIYMLGWENKLLQKLISLGVKHELYKRYMDDIGVALYGFNKGWFYSKEQNSMIYERGGAGTMMIPMMSEP